MAMQMQRAFDPLFLTKVNLYSYSVGAYNEHNQWVEGTYTPSLIIGVLKTGNQLSRFEEGEALINTDGGARYSEYRTLYLTNKFYVQVEDKVEYLGKYYNVLRKSDEDVYGYYSVLLEKTLTWEP